MLCQNCASKEASVHLKRIVNGESVELHLCGDCAAGLGYGDLFSGFGLEAARMFGAMQGRGSVSRLGSRQLRCETCGFRFEDIAQTSRVGCPDCYAVFGDKLIPLLQKLHGKAPYLGKTPAGTNEAAQNDLRRKLLQRELNDALDANDAPRAAKLRAQLGALAKGGTNK